MRNLFIMHTQYNIISAIAVLEKDLAQDINDLVIIAEFPLTEAYINGLKQIFRYVWIAQAEFDNSKGVQKLLSFFMKYKNCTAARKKEYDRVITAQEQYFDTLLISKIRRKNPSLKWYSVEEDAYYDLGKSAPRVSCIRKVAKEIYYAFLILIFGKNYLYEPTPCYGANSNIDRIYLTYPAFARHEIGCKEKKELKAAEIQRAVQRIYKQEDASVRLDKNSILFFSDLVQRYRNRDAIESLIQSLAKFSESEKRKLYIKYHPRETERISGVPIQNELPGTLPAELILAKNSERNVTIIGNQSTAVFLSRKLGYQTISFVRIENPNKLDESAKFYEKIGIKCINHVEEVKELLL